MCQKCSMKRGAIWKETGKYKMSDKIYRMTIKWNQIKKIAASKKTSWAKALKVQKYIWQNIRSLTGLPVPRKNCKKREQIQTN